MRTVELHNAYTWACDDCGRDNFARACELEPDLLGVEDGADAARIAEVLGVDDELAEEISAYLAEGGEGNWLTRPNRVTCEHCGATFAVARAE